LFTNKGETLALVGESGYGKSTTALTILRLEEATMGMINFEGKNTLSFNSSKLKEMRKKI